MQQSDDSHGSQRRILFFLSCAAFAAAATTRIMDAVLPKVALEFGVPIGSVAFVATAYAFAYGLFQIAFGPLCDRYGKYKFVLLVTFGSAIAAFTCSLSGSLSSLAVGRVVSGAVAAAIVLGIHLLLRTPPAFDRPARRSFSKA